MRYRLNKKTATLRVYDKDSLIITIPDVDVNMSKSEIEWFIEEVLAPIGYESVDCYNKEGKVPKVYIQDGIFRNMGYKDDEFRHRLKTFISYLETVECLCMGPNGCIHSITEVNHYTFDVVLKNNVKMRYKVTRRQTPVSNWKVYPISDYFVYRVE